MISKDCGAPLCEALQRLEDEGYIVVVDELPVAPAPGLRQRGVA